MKCPFKAKVCIKCKRILIVCDMNFPKRKSSKDGFRNECKECRKKYSKQYREEHKEELSEKKKQHYKEKQEYYKEKQRKYSKEHEEQILEYRQNNKKKISERNKQYRQNNKKKISEYQKQYRENNPHIQFNNNIKRRQLEENQGNGITKEQWLEMMEYFDWCCAYSGEYIGGDKNKNIRSIDHIIPLSKNGLNEIWNCVPMHRLYNDEKFTRNMLDWYKQQLYFSEERLIKIYAWIEYAYEKWGV